MIDLVVREGLIFPTDLEKALFRRAIRLLTMFNSGYVSSSRIAIAPQKPATARVSELDSTKLSNRDDETAENTMTRSGNMAIPFPKSKPVFLEISLCFLAFGFVCYG